MRRIPRGAILNGPQGRVIAAAIREVVAAHSTPADALVVGAVARDGTMRLALTDGRVIAKDGSAVIPEAGNR